MSRSVPLVIWVVTAAAFVAIMLLPVHIDHPILHDCYGDPAWQWVGRSERTYGITDETLGARNSCVRAAKARTTTAIVVALAGTAISIMLEFSRRRPSSSHKKGAVRARPSRSPSTTAGEVASHSPRSGLHQVREPRVVSLSGVPHWVVALSYPPTSQWVEAFSLAVPIRPEVSGSTIIVPVRIAAGGSEVSKEELQAAVKFANEATV